tara:strand:- start:34 stop:327 length:294 start_codon:yes stop_codon:yes gene_type:complete
MKLTKEKLKELIKEQLDEMVGGVAMADEKTAGCDKKAYMSALKQVADKINNSTVVIPAEQRIAMYQKVLDKYPECHKQAGSSVMHNKQLEENNNEIN